ncbi:MAG: ImmA/IrrE family metallo-endopeptidase [Winogradskyella sp.]|uniref:ImmA/IrrE family metallo-endopeptidase n=1 Tax=Winogradskyella sp. TaxID=1883156 RepID=UPI00385CCDAB
MKDSNCFDVFPTPVEEIIQYANLKIDEGFDLSKIEESFIDNLKYRTKGQIQNLLSGLSKIKGIFFREENIIYVDLKDKTNRKYFVALHELGHGILPWQNELSLAFDNKSSLSIDVEEQFELEANLFASATLFQHERFNSELEKLPLSIKSGMALAKKFGSSNHAALRNYILKSKNRCGMIVLNKIPEPKWNEPFCSLRNLFYSKSFLQDIGKLDIPETFGYNWEFAQDFKHKRRLHDTGEIEFKNSMGDTIKCKYHYFFNYYNAFVFFFPIEEKKKSRTKIILQNVN